MRDWAKYSALRALRYWTDGAYRDKILATKREYYYKKTEGKVLRRNKKDTIPCLPPIPEEKPMVVKVESILTFD